MNTENIINRDSRDRIEALLGPRFLNDASGHPTDVLLSVDGYRAMLEVVASAASTASLALADAAANTLDDLGDLADILTANLARARIAGGEEMVPAAVADRVLAGENPIRAWRRHRGMKQGALAAACGVSQGHISDIESGKAASLDLARRIARTLDVTLDDLEPASEAD